jgi:hypothetical protein
MQQTEARLGLTAERAFSFCGWVFFRSGPLAPTGALAHFRATAATGQADASLVGMPRLGRLLVALQRARLARLASPPGGLFPLGRRRVMAPLTDDSTQMDEPMAATTKWRNPWRRPHGGEEEGGAKRKTASWRELI